MFIKNKINHSRKIGYVAVFATYRPKSDHHQREALEIGLILRKNHYISVSIYITTFF